MSSDEKKRGATVIDRWGREVCSSCMRPKKADPREACIQPDWHEPKWKTAKEPLDG